MKTKITVSDQNSYKAVNWADVRNGNFVLVSDGDGRTTHLCVVNMWEGRANLISLNDPEGSFWLDREENGRGLPKLLAIVKEANIKFKV